MVSGRSHPTLALDIANHLGVELGEANLREFANGEIHCKYDISIRGCDVFIVQTHSSPVNDSLMEHLIMIDAAKRASARRIIAVCPYYGYSRQDRKSTGREPITAKLVADMLSAAGADRVISVDLHSGQIQGFFNTPFDHLTAAARARDLPAARIIGNDVVVVAPDAGRVKVAERYSQHLGVELALVHKTRPRGTINEVKARHVWSVTAEGRHCVLIDDMIDTAGTICAAAELLSDAGASEISVMATHAMFSDPAVDRLKAAPISRVVVTDTLPVAEDRYFDKLEILSVSKNHRRRHRCGLRGHLGFRDLRRGQPGLSVRVPAGASRTGPLVGSAAVGGYAGWPFAGGLAPTARITVLYRFRTIPRRASLWSMSPWTAEVGRIAPAPAPTRRLRREGKIPGVIYGHGTDPGAGGRGGSGAADRPQW